jgi:hypothetical protein
MPRPCRHARQRRARTKRTPWLFLEPSKLRAVGLDDWPLDNPDRRQSR